MVTKRTKQKSPRVLAFRVFVFAFRFLKKRFFFVFFRDFVLSWLYFVYSYRNAWTGSSFAAWRDG